MNILTLLKSSLLLLFPLFIFSSEVAAQRSEQPVEAKIVAALKSAVAADRGGRWKLSQERNSRGELRLEIRQTAGNRDALRFRCRRGCDQTIRLRRRGANGGGRRNGQTGKGFRRSSDTA